MRGYAMLFVLIVCGLGAPAQGGKLTLEEARGRMIKRTPPAFWVSGGEDLAARLGKVKRGEATAIAQSPGGRPLFMVTYGKNEAIEHRANYNSAIGGNDARSYMDKQAREKPVILFLGPVHGQEVEGLTGLMSLIQIMETGKDLRGRRQDEIKRLGEQCRLLIIPLANPDGAARFEPGAMLGLTKDDLNFWGQGTWSDDTIAEWPISKRQHPWAGPKVKFRGCYFDDAGVNPMHDEFFAPMSTEAPALLKAAREAGPDLVVSLHSHENPPALLRPAYQPLEAQGEAAKVAERFYAMCEERGLPHAREAFKPQAEQGARPSAFNLVSALYHTSGAPSFTFECPHGLRDAKSCKVTFEQILDIQLALYEAMMRHALEMKKN